MVQVYKENLALNRFVTGKWKSILRAFFSDHCEYSLILQQNWTSSCFLKVSYNAESESISMNFSYAVMLQPIVLSCTLKGSFTDAWFYRIMYWWFGKYRFTELHRSSKCWCISLSNITKSISIRKSLTIGKLSRSQ